MHKQTINHNPFCRWCKAISIRMTHGLRTAATNQKYKRFQFSFSNDYLRFDDQRTLWNTPSHSVSFGTRKLYSWRWKNQFDILCSDFVLFVCFFFIFAGRPNYFIPFGLVCVPFWMVAVVVRWKSLLLTTDLVAYNRLNFVHAQFIQCTYYIHSIIR